MTYPFIDPSVSGATVNPATPGNAAPATGTIVGGQYLTSPPTLTNTQFQYLMLDTQGDLKVYLASAMFGEIPPGSAVGDQVINSVQTGVLLTGAVYNTTEPSPTNGQTSALQADRNGSLKVITSAKSGPINSAATTTLKTGAGVLHTLTILGGVAGAITAYDNTAGSGTVLLPTFTPGNVTVPVTLILDMAFATGLTIVTGAATILAASYR